MTTAIEWKDDREGTVNGHVLFEIRHEGSSKRWGLVRKLPGYNDYVVGSFGSVRGAKQAARIELGKLEKKESCR